MHHFSTFPLHANSLFIGISNIILTVTEKNCSDSSLLCIADQHFFLQHYTDVFIPASGGKMDWPGNLLPHMHIESHSNVTLCPVFYLKAYLCCIEPFTKKLYRLCEISLFLGNKRQHLPACAKMISSWVRKVLSMALHIYLLGTLNGAAASSALVAGVFLWSTLLVGDWARVSSPAGHYLSTYITTTDWHQEP